MKESERKNSVLIVDDIPGNVQLISKILYQEGINIIIAQSGKEALSAVSHEIPDLILLDVMMPDISGFEVCTQLKQQETTARIPIIFLTAKTQPEDILQGFECGAVDYVTKPFRTPELLSRVFNHLELKRARDLISEQNRRLLEQNEELHKLNATKDKFFSIIAHDLKNPFGQLMMFAELLQEELQKISTDRLEHYINVMCQASKQGYRLLENLLEWSRTQTDKIPFEPRTIKLESLVTESVEGITHHADNKQLLIDIDIPDGSTLYADHYMVAAILRNLLSNAVKFTHEGGTIGITAVNSDGEFEITVTDSGVGIAEENIAKLFRIDAQHSTRGTNQEKGTGLGLILCKEFIEKHGGHISVESEAGKGSCFRLLFPSQPSWEEL
ncbi:MAG: hybrid sensor histidine kinase/response regulator [bacterium]|nr:hybrid sensor histidine kinase/response regulator [bacterium]